MVKRRVAWRGGIVYKGCLPGGGGSLPGRERVFGQTTIPSPPPPPPPPPHEMATVAVDTHPTGMHLTMYFKKGGIKRCYHFFIINCACTEISISEVTEQ